MFKTLSGALNGTRILALALALTLAFGCLGGTAFAADRETLSPSDVYEKNVGSTVGITTSITTNYWGYQTQAAAAGSGFVYRDDGVILTNYHVVEDSESITVKTYDDRSFAAELVGYDKSSDVAVLKIDASDLTPVTIGDSDALRVGDTVAAIGNPLGELTFSMSLGIVSALGREVTFSSGSTMALIQTDAAINAGNSGGALFNMYGEVVGVTNAKYSGRGSSSEASIDNIGFAIPINQVCAVAESILEYGYAVKPYLGVSVGTVSEELRTYGIPAGATVQGVNEDSPAEKAGLQVKDIITAVNGEEIASSSDLVRVVSTHKPGDELTLAVYRTGEGEQLTLTVTLAEKPQDPEPAQTETQQQPGTQQQGGTYEFNPFDLFPFFGYTG